VTEEIKQWLRENLIISVESEYDGNCAHIKLSFSGEDKEFCSAYIYIPDNT
jgi:hypothetical protein